jgi:hypothetical protein
VGCSIELYLNTRVATTRCVIIRTAPLNAKLLVPLQKNFTAVGKIYDNFKPM